MQSKREIKTIQTECDLLRDVVFLDELLDVVSQVDGLELGAVSLERHAVRSDQELFKVPREVAALNGLPNDQLRAAHQVRRVVRGRGQRLPEELEQGGAVGAVHLNLAEHGGFRFEARAGTNMLQCRQDLIICTIFLKTQRNIWSR